MARRVGWLARVAELSARRRFEIPAARNLRAMTLLSYPVVAVMAFAATLSS